MTERPKRVVSLRRRWYSPTGKREFAKWAGYLLVVGGLAAGIWAASVEGMLLTDSETWDEAVDLLVEGESGKELVHAGVTVLAALGALLGLSAVGKVISLRPWRPHLGGAHLVRPVMPPPASELLRARRSTPRELAEGPPPLRTPSETHQHPETAQEPATAPDETPETHQHPETAQEPATAPDETPETHQHPETAQEPATAPDETPEADVWGLAGVPAGEVGGGDAVEGLVGVGDAEPGGGGIRQWRRDVADELLEGHDRLTEDWEASGPPYGGAGVEGPAEEDGGGEPAKDAAVEGGVVGPGFVPGWPFDGVGSAEGPVEAEPLPGLEIPEPVEAEEEDPLAGLGRVFRLCGRNPAMKASREELLALVWVSQGKVAQGEAAKITGRGDQSARSGLRRATDDGWLVFLGEKFWQLADDFITDLDLLARAVDESDLALAEAVGKGFKKPLSRLDAAWLDHRVKGPTPREEITALADEALAMAVDQWPDSKVLRRAVDKLYSG